MHNGYVEVHTSRGMRLNLRCKELLTPSRAAAATAQGGYGRKGGSGGAQGLRRPRAGRRAGTYRGGRGPKGDFAGSRLGAGTLGEVFAGSPRAC